METPPEKVLWIVSDPKGNPVRLTEERAEHIIDHHPEMEPHLPDLQAVITDPVYILPDKKDADTRLFCSDQIKGTPAKWLVAPVRYDVSESGMIMTAWTTSELPNRRILWHKKNLLS